MAWTPKCGPLPPLNSAPPPPQTAANSSGCDITSTKNIAECMRVVGKEDILTLAKVPLNIFNHAPHTLIKHLMVGCIDHTFCLRDTPPIHKR